MAEQLEIVMDRGAYGCLLRLAGMLTVLREIMRFEYCSTAVNF